MPTKSNHDLAAEKFASQLHNHAQKLATMIEGELGTLGAKEMSKQGMLEIVARNWNDRNPVWGPQHTGFREWLLLTMGPSNFMKLYEEGVKRGLLHPDAAQPMPMAPTVGGPMTSGPPATLTVNPTPPTLPGPLVGAMTNANG